MKVHKLDSFIRGWFVGDFSPTIYKNQGVEVAVQTYSSGDFEKEHYHKVATEITVIVKGSAKMAGFLLKEGDILEVSPGESASFEALEDTTAVVVKYPSAPSDKFMKEN